jgi:hypothetical protein
LEIKKGLLIVSASIIMLFGFFEMKVSDGLNTDEIITQNLFDEWYEKTWSKSHFPKQGIEYSGANYAWGWSYAANSLIDMYKATGETKYLDYFIPQANYILNHTDKDLGITSFSNTSLSLPAWSDRGHYTSRKFNYTYPVHTGMITLPILRFVDVVRSDNLSKYNKMADHFLTASGQALSVHNQPNMWIDISKTEGFFRGHPYGASIISEANKIGVPNRILIYLAACGLYDKLTGKGIYTKQIEKSLRFFKNTLLRYDNDFDAYYWKYWIEGTSQYPGEDISHAALTVYGLFVLHEEAGFAILKDSDFIRIKNIIYKMVNKDTPPKIRKNIHNLDNEEKLYYNSEENPYYYQILRWSFLGIYDEKIFDRLNGVYRELYLREKPSSSGLFSIASYLSTKKELKNKDGQKR